VTGAGVGAVGVLVAGAVAASVTAAVQRGLTARPPGGAGRWTRLNHRGSEVTLAAGPALAVGAAAGVAVTPGLRPVHRAAGVLVALGAGGVGAYDDLAGAGSSKGFRGHLSALRRGELTTGVVKIGGIGLAGLAGSALVSDSPVDAVVGGAVVAGSANLLNLLDLRPGRAVKAGLLHLPLLLVQQPAGPLAGAALGAATAALPDDLAERTMLGDAGANALGALLGLAMVAREGRRARLLHLAVLVALTAASERVSFTAVIERTPSLRRLDELGRLPAER
jgi:UDP-GlcNAc:undecaprenyl-phosphate/decaprenyl-phosphate GlcNAc-1-phosphate transferase